MIHNKMRVLQQDSKSYDSEKTFIISHKNRISFKTFIKQLPVAVAFFDNNLNYIVTSKRWTQETRLATHDIIGKNLYDVVPDIPIKWKKIHQRALKGESLQEEEDLFNRQDGSQEWWRWKVLPWYAAKNKVGGIILFVEQITERKFLELRMKEMIATLNRSNAELERFAHICAHDLNEPLRTIANYGQLLETDYKDKFDPVGKDYLDHIMKSIKHAKSLVDGILAYSQLEATGLKKSSFSLNHLINALLIVLENNIQEKKAYIYFDKLPTVYGDKALISCVFQNLLNNSLKFNKSDNAIVYITAKEKKDFYLFCVEDNGIGIEEDYQEQIFALFKRLHHISEYKGTGMGLSIAKKIVEAHGGKMWVKSIPQEGAQFFFTLPKTNEL